MGQVINDPYKVVNLLVAIGYMLLLGSDETQWSTYFSTQWKIKGSCIMFVALKL